MRNVMVAAALCAIVLVPVAANAQSFNVDFNGLQAPDGFGIPANTYGGGANSAGTWNAINNSGAPIPLVGLNGAATGVSLSADNGATFSFNNAGTTGDNEALLDDLFDIGGVGSSSNIRVTGLAAGNYQVFTYGWAPDSATFRTSVTVAGSPQGAQQVGGAWGGAPATGVTHALHTVTVGASQEIDIAVSTAAGFGSLNGVQLVIPEPATLGLLAIGSLALIRRRR